MASDPRTNALSSHVILGRVFSSLREPLGLRSVRHAYDTVAEGYATHFPDTRAEAALDLAMIDAFAEAVTLGDDARVSTPGVARVG